MDSEVLEAQDQSTLVRIIKDTFLNIYNLLSRLSPEAADAFQKRNEYYRELSNLFSASREAARPLSRRLLPPPRVQVQDLHPE